MSPDAVNSLLAVGFGFAFAGLIASFYQLITERPPSFALLRMSASRSPFVTVPLIMFAAPFIIMRNIIRASQIEDGSFGFAMLATMVAGFWSLLSGTLVVRAIEVISFFVA